MSVELDWKLLLEYFKVVASWPPLAVIGLICFMRQFGTEIGVFLTNVRPKGPVFDTLPLQQPVDTPKPPEVDEGQAEGGDVDTSNAHDEPSPPESDLAATTVLAREAALRIADALLAPDRQREEFRYLNSLLVITTQLTLDRVVAQGALNVADYSASWPQMTAQNRSNMLTVLYQHGLIDIVDGVIAPTDKGRTYAAAPERQAWVNAQLSVWMPTPATPVGGGALGGYSIPPPPAENLFARASAGTAPTSVSGGNAMAKNYFAIIPEKEN